MTTASFTARQLKDGKITIPKPTRELLGIEVGDLLEITVEKKLSLAMKICREDKDGAGT